MNGILSMLTANPLLGILVGLVLCGGAYVLLARREGAESSAEEAPAAPAAAAPAAAVDEDEELAVAIAAATIAALSNEEEEVAAIMGALTAMLGEDFSATIRPRTAGFTVRRLRRGSNAWAQAGWAENCPRTL